MKGPDPTCPSTSRHRSIRAHREAGCTCLGESWDAWQAYKQRAADAERNRRRSNGGFRSFPEPGALVATDKHRKLLARTDLACRNEDPEIFEIEGIETSSFNRARIVAARTVCRSCPALNLCAEVALADDDTWTFRGGMSPEERYRLQRGLWGVAS